MLIALLVLAGGLAAFATMRRPKPVVAVLHPPPPAKATAVPAPAVARETETDGSVSLRSPPTVLAGAPFYVVWSGPNHPGDFITIVDPQAPAGTRGYSQETAIDEVLKLIAPIEPGPQEIRYVIGRTGRILGRIPITVSPIPVSLVAPDHAVLGSIISVTWSGPNNPRDYLTVVPSGGANDADEDHVNTSLGSPLNITVPDNSGDAEIQYVAGGSHKVLGRRPLTVTLPITTLSTPTEAPAGSMVEIRWVGPDHPGDCITIVPKGARDGIIANSTKTAQGSPLTVVVPIDPGHAEFRYMTGRRSRVLARSQITLLPVTASLAAPAEAPPESTISVSWAGPSYKGDFIAIVPLAAPDATGPPFQVRNGSPAKIRTPKQTGPAEIRYISGQGHRVLGRQKIVIRPSTL